MKIPLILFSGGLDSTFMADEFFRVSKMNVDTLTVLLKNNDSKNAAETAAREKIYKYWETNYQTKKGGFGVFVLNKHVHVDEVPSHATGFKQMLPWLVAAFSFSCPERHSEVCIGYVSGDQASSSIPHLETAWLALWKAIRPFSTPVPLSFPLKLIDKTTILEKIDPALAALTWTCELPVKTKTGYKKCNKCTPCVRQKFEMQVIQNDDKSNLRKR